MPNLLPTTADVYQGRLDANRWHSVGGLLSDIGRTALPLAGVGAGMRGLLGIINMIRPKPKPEEDDVNDLSLPVKMGGWDWLTGAAAQTPDDVWWGTGAKVLAAPAALLGGYKLMDGVMDNRRRQQQQQDVEAAKARFQKALGMGGPAKTAADRSELGEQLDRLYDLMAQRVKSAANPIGNAIGAVGIPLAAMFAMAAYQSGRRKQRGQLLDQAMAVRDQQRQGGEPLQFHVPSPVDDVG